MKHQLEHEVEGDGTTEQLAKWIVGLRADEVPPRVLERAKHLILDGLGCGLVGARVPWSEKMLDAVSQYEPDGPCSVIGSEKVRARLGYPRRGRLFRSRRLSHHSTLAASESMRVLIFSPALRPACGGNPEWLHHSGHRAR